MRNNSGRKINLGPLFIYFVVHLGPLLTKQNKTCSSVELVSGITYCKQDEHSMKESLGALDLKSEHCLRTWLLSGKDECILAFPCGSFATRMLPDHQLCHCHLISIRIWLNCKLNTLICEFLFNLLVPSVNESSKIQT